METHKHHSSLVKKQKSAGNNYYDSEMQHTNKQKKTTLYKIPHLDTKENINIDTYFDQNIPCRTDTRSNKSTISKNI